MKIKDAKINIVPKLDVNGMRKVSKQIGESIKKQLDNIGKTLSVGGKVATGLNQGLQLIREIKNMLAQARGETQSLIAFGDNLGDLASALGTSTGRLSTTMIALTGGVTRDANGNWVAKGGDSSFANTQNLLRKYLQYAEQNNIKGDLANDFVYRLKEINKASTNDEKIALAQKYFSTRNLVDLQDALAGVQNWDTNLAGAVELAKQGDLAISQAGKAGSRIDALKDIGLYNRLIQSGKGGLIDAEVKATEVEQINAYARYAKESADSIMATTRLNETIDTAIHGVLTTGINTLSGLFDFLDKKLPTLFEGLNSTISSVQESFGGFIEFVKKLNPFAKSKEGKNTSKDNIDEVSR